jgi:Tol biopolymer transport system component/predicted Ser/Thr protein kinase
VAESVPVPLKAGDLLGPYEIGALLGAGGMGEVYRARDTRLDRTVAIKVLPAALAADHQFRERFEREARAISALEHPNVCALYDVGEKDGTSFLVMQYLEGETLADRLTKGGLPLEQTLQYAMQIADALDRAHRAGIVHRDLKPGNIMVTKSGAKLLDFGLAKASAPISGAGLSMLPTTPPGLTAQGTILGTLQYMAPEQLEGKEADARTDIFAFGAVVYEMLTGKKAFEGKSQASLISAIMSAQPPAPSSLQPLAPVALDQVVVRCLAKDADDRWQSARDIKLQLAGITESPSTPGPPAAMPIQSRERIAWAVGALALLGLAVAAGVLASRRAPAASLQAAQFVILPPENARFANDVSGHAIAPDGRQLVFGAARADGARLLWVRPLDSLTARPLPGTEDGNAPFWSPDSKSIGFFANGKLKRVDLAGGPPQTLADASFALGGTWNQDGVIVYAPNLANPLFRIPASGGTPTPVTSFDERTHETIHASPSFLPDGRHFLLYVQSNELGVYAGSLDSKEIKQVVRSDAAGTYAPPGYLLFLRGSTLMAQPFDAVRLAVSGSPQRVVDQVWRFITQAGFSVSNNGTLVVRPTAPLQTELVWVDRLGKRIAVVAPPGDYGEIALSPDENRVAFSRAESAAPDIWLRDLQRRVTSRFTLNPGVDNVPIWSPDGRTVAFASDHQGGLDIYQRPSNAGGSEEPLLPLKASPIMFPSDWSSDGRYLTYYRTDQKTQNDVWILPLFGDRKPMALLHGEFNESQSQFSPDVKWIGYVSDESGSPQVYVQSFPTLTGKWQVSTDGGTQPKWRRDGKELFYLARDRKLMAVTIKAGGTFEADAPRPLFETRLEVGDLRQTYAVSADGNRFLLNAPIETSAPPLTVVLNWPALLTTVP